MNPRHRLSNPGALPADPQGDPVARAAAPVSPRRDTLVAWYRANRRDLPWRRRPTPYRVWVSEIMLQQTRVEVVTPYFLRFIKRFPTLTRLAAAPLDEVLAAWSGLGYYRRARQLHAGARHVIERHRGRFPREVAAALEVPGVGRYTAGAILSIAYGVRAPILDGNVIRVLARLFGVAGDPSRAATRDRLWSLAERFVEDGDPATVNQALMEFGALVCTPRSPRCTECPLAAVCVARREDLVDRLPETGARRGNVDVACTVLLVRDADRLLLRRRGPGELLPGLWDLPGAFGGEHGDAGEPLAAVVGALPAEVELGESLGTLRHSVTYRRIRLNIVQACVIPRSRGVRSGARAGARAAAANPRADANTRWCTLEEALALALSAPARKILMKWGAESPRNPVRATHAPVS